MTVDTKKLRELAGNATPGPWRVYRCHNAGDGEACGVRGPRDDDGPGYQGIFYDAAYDECHHVVSNQDARFIAALNPQTAIALLDEIERLRDHLARHFPARGSVLGDLTVAEEHAEDAKSELATIVDEAADRFDSRPLYRASVEARSELADDRDSLRSQLASAQAEVARMHREVDHAQSEETVCRDVLRAEHQACTELRRQLAAMTAARDELATIATELNGDNGDDEELIRRREQIAQIKGVGQ